MNKTIFILAVLLFTAPAWSAGVTITASNDVNVVTISYDNSEAEDVRAFGLNIVCTNDVNIVVIDVNNEHFWVNPGSIDINDNGKVDSNGSSICYKSQFVPDTPAYNGTLVGPPDSNMTIEMASLYEGANSPPKQGWLVKFHVNGSTCITVSGNAIRCGPGGNDGAVMEDPCQAVAVTYNGCCVELDTCNKPCGLDTSGWQGFGVPDNCLSSDDVAYIVSILNDYSDQGYWVCAPDPNYDACLDVAGWQGFGVPDNCLSSDDVAFIVAILNDYSDQGYWVCAPDPNYINCDP